VKLVDTLDSKSGSFGSGGSSPPTGTKQINPASFGGVFCLVLGGGEHRHRGSTNCVSNLDAKRSGALAKQVTRAPRLLSSFRPLVPNKRNPAYSGVFCLVLGGGEHRHRGSTNCESNLDAKRSEALAKQVTRAPRLLSSFRPLVPNKRNPAYGGVFCLGTVCGEHRHRGSTNCVSNLDAKRSGSTCCKSKLDAEQQLKSLHNRY
jgi:hypothetical protein